MALAGIPRERALATLVYLLEATLIRIGNAAYARANESFGLSTLASHHVVVEGATLTFEFTGKSGKKWRVTIRDRRAAAVMRACQELPGQKLFQYLDEEGRRHAVTSADVNAYLQVDLRPAYFGEGFPHLVGHADLRGDARQGGRRRRPNGASSGRSPRRCARPPRRSATRRPSAVRATFIPACSNAHGSGELYRRMALAARREAEAGRLKPHEQALVRLLRRLERAKAAVRAEVEAIVAAAAPRARRYDEAPPPAP